MSRLCQGVPGKGLDLSTTNLLGRYDATTATVTVFSKVVRWCADALEVDLVALENVVVLHETVHAVCHLGIDRDGRIWDSFALPDSDSTWFRPDQLHEGLAQFFTAKMLERLQDREMTRCFDVLTDNQPPEYQGWRRMRDVPIERVRAVLIAARTGLGDSLAELQL